ncbi:MAG: hypothetical protein RIG62_04455 [Cyclobacteriaceae bacterium]
MTYRQPIYLFFRGGKIENPGKRIINDKQSWLEYAGEYRHG